MMLARESIALVPDLHAFSYCSAGSHGRHAIVYTVYVHVWDDMRLGHSYGIHVSVDWPALPEHCRQLTMSNP